MQDEKDKNGNEQEFQLFVASEISEKQINADWRDKNDQQKQKIIVPWAGRIIGCMMDVVREISFHLYKRLSPDVIVNSALDKEHGEHNPRSQQQCFLPLLSDEQDQPHTA